jgi:hypothetical protein
MASPTLPLIVVFILRNAAIGSAIGMVLALALVATDAGGIRTLIASTGDGVAPVALLCIGFATLFGSLYTGAAIMGLHRE